MGGVARGVRRLVVVQHVCFYGGSVYVCVRVRACVRVGVYACVYAHTCVCVCAPATYFTPVNRSLRLTCQVMGYSRANSA